MLVNHCWTELLLLTHPFNSLFSWTTWLRRHQKDKPFWILMVQEMIGWQWHQLDHMQIICTLLEREITMPVSHHLVFTGRMPFLPSNQQCQGTEGVSLLNRNTIQDRNLTVSRCSELWHMLLWQLHRSYSVQELTSATGLVNQPHIDTKRFHTIPTHHFNCQWFAIMYNTATFLPTSRFSWQHWVTIFRLQSSFKLRFKPKVSFKPN